MFGAVTDIAAIHIYIHIALFLYRITSLRDIPQSGIYVVRL